MSLPRPFLLMPPCQPIHFNLLLRNFRLLKRELLIFTNRASQNRNMSSEAKRALRKDVTSRVSTLTAEQISDQSGKAQTTLVSLPAYQQANRLSIYLSMPGGEAQTDKLLSDAFSSGKKVFVPYMHRPVNPNPEGKKKRRVVDMLRLESMAEFERLEKDSWGIPSLPENGIEERENAKGGKGADSVDTGGGKGGLDLIVMPGVAFDGDGSRLGHGAGFYDRFLAAFCEGGRKKPFLGKLEDPTLLAIWLRLTRGSRLVFGRAIRPRLASDSHHRHRLERGRCSRWEWNVGHL